MAQIKFKCFILLKFLMNQVVEEIRKYLNEEKFFFVRPEKLLNNLKERVPEEIYEEYERFYSNPKDTRAIRDHYNIVGKTEDIHSACFRREKESFLKVMHDLVDEMKCKSVAEGGCGTGLDVCFLAKKFPEVDFYGYDVSSKNCNITKERARNRNLNNIHLVSTIIESAPFPSEKFDITYFNSSLLEEGELGYHSIYGFFISPQSENKLIKRLMESRRILRNDGRLVFTMSPGHEIAEDMVVGYVEGNGFKFEQKQRINSWIDNCLYIFKKE